MVQKNIYRQAALAGLTVVLTIVILFAMTSAWYTNIVQTSGLVFEAESWGFDGEIIVNDTPITAAPGDTGLVHLEVQNTSDSISAISVNVSKAGMLEEMQKRLFFYVDTHMTRDGETMDRVYLNNYEGYTYTIFSNGRLTLTEQINNAPQLKWQWVYDVLGYYVLAQPQDVTVATTATDGTTTEETTVQKMIIKEYLRPIEYDFDEATTTVTNENNQLVVTLDTVDGKTDPYTYLWNLSKTDGYDGEIQKDKQLDNGFYPVDVDENGYGVYAYLCSYSEIELATKYDTKLGELAYQKAKNPNTLTETETAMLSHTATLTISAQKNETTAINVNTLKALSRAISQGDADVIQLSSDITIPADGTLTIPKNTRVMVDLNGHTITSQDDTAIKAEPGSSLTMINGTLTGTESTGKTYGISTTGAEVVMSQVTVSDFQYGIYMGDNEGSNELDSRVHMVGCTVNAETCAVFISGNGVLSDQKTQLIIENSELTSDNIVISGNGDTSGNGRWGTDIQITNSTITGNSTKLSAGIYQPQQNSTLMVHSSTVSGYTGIAIKGGSVSIVDSKINGTGTTHNTPAFGGSGFSDTGDAVYIETNYDYEILLEISGSSTLTKKAADSRSLRVYKEDATNVAVKIYSGTFAEAQPDAYIAEGSVKNGTVVTVQTESTE